MGLLYETNMVVVQYTLMIILFVISGLANWPEWSADHMILAAPAIVPLVLIRFLGGHHLTHISFLLVLFNEVNMVVLTVISVFCSVSIRHLLEWWTGCSGPIPLLRSVQDTNTAMRYVKSTVM